MVTVMAGSTSLLLGLSACATADSDRPSRAELAAAGTVSGVTEDGTAVRCERVRVTGSRQTQRICLPESRWAEREREAQELREGETRGREGINTPGSEDRSGRTPGG